MSQGDIAQESSKKKVAGVFGRLFERGEHSRSAKTATLDLDDIQGFILRGYRMPMVRHFLLTVGVPAQARKLVGRLVSGDESDAPQITTAEEWQVGFAAGPRDDAAEVSRHKPDYCLNLGITWQGIIALEIKDRVPTLSFNSTTMRSAVFLPTPEICDKALTSPLATAPRKDVAFMPLKMFKAIFGPMPLTVLMSSRNNSRSAAVMKP